MRHEWSRRKVGRPCRTASCYAGAVAAAYAVFVTPDRKLEYQQHIPRVGLAVVVLRAHTNRIEDIAPLVPALLQAPPGLRAGTVTHVVV